MRSSWSWNHHTEVSAGGLIHPTYIEKQDVLKHIVTSEASLEIDYELWLRWREEAYRTFKSDIEIGYVDPDIIDLIELIFKKKNIFTISSCSGRIVIIDSWYPWQRDNSYIVFKKHEPIDYNEVLSIVKDHNPRMRFWMIASGPIFHFVTSSLHTALNLLKAVRALGFKHSGIMSIRRDGVIVEVISGTWTSFLLKEENCILVSVEMLPKIITIANEILLEGKKKLQKLKSVVERLDI